MMFSMRVAAFPLVVLVLLSGVLARADTEAPQVRIPVMKAMEARLPMRFPQDLVVDGEGRAIYLGTGPEGANGVREVLAQPTGRPVDERATDLIDRLRNVVDGAALDDELHRGQGGTILLTFSPDAETLGECSPCARHQDEVRAFLREKGLDVHVVHIVYFQ